MHYWLLSLLVFCSIPAVADDFYGVIYSNSKIEQSMEDSGTVKMLHVSLGQSVKKGDLLITLESGVQELEQQRNRLVWKDTKELDSHLRRFSVLSEKYSLAQSLYSQTRSISRDELDGLSLELIQIEGRIDQIKEQKLRDEIEYHLSSLRLAKRKLRAAIDGVVISINPKSGEWVKAGDPVIGLVNADDLFVNINIPDHLARKIKPNESKKVMIANLPEQQSIVDFISPVADPASGLVEIRLKIKNEKKIIRPGVKSMVSFD